MNAQFFPDGRESLCSFSSWLSHLHYNFMLYPSSVRGQWRSYRCFMCGDRVLDYCMFDYHWLHDNIHLMTEKAEGIVNAIGETGDFGFFDSAKFDHTVSKVINSLIRDMSI